MVKLTNAEKKQVCNAILNINELNSAGVRFVESGVKDDFVKPTNSLPKIWVVLKVEETDKNANNNINRENRDLEQRPKRIAESIVSAAFTCGAAVAAGAAVIGTSAATITTFGAAAPLVVLTWVGAVASAAKCGTDMARALNESLDNKWFNPENNEILDQNKAFSFAENMISIAENANIISSISAGKKLIEISKLSGKSLFTILKGDGLSKAEKIEIAKYLYLKGVKSKTSAKNSFNAMRKSGKNLDVMAIKQISKLKEQLMATLEDILKKIGQKTASTVFVYILTED